MIRAGLLKVDIIIGIVIIVLTSIVSKVTCLRCHQGMTANTIVPPTDATDCPPNWNAKCAVQMSTIVENTRRTYACVEAGNCGTEKEFLGNKIKTTCCQGELCNNEVFMKKVSTATVKCHTGISSGDEITPPTGQAECSSAILNSKCAVQMATVGGKTTRMYACASTGTCGSETEARGMKVTTRCCTGGDLCNDKAFMTSSSSTANVIGSLKCHAGMSGDVIEDPTAQTHCPANSNYKCAVQSASVGDVTTRVYFCALSTECEQDAVYYAWKIKTRCCIGKLCNDKAFMSVS